MEIEHPLFATASPGLERYLLDEVTEAGFAAAKQVPGGVAFVGGLSDAMRANLHLRGAGQILWRIASFRAVHLAQLDKRARKLPWAELLRPDVPVRIDAVCRQSKIYHAGAARDRIARAVTDALGVEVSQEAAVRLMLRIEDDLAVISLDTSGAPLHKRGHKVAVGKAPMRETLAALFLRACGYQAGMPLVDPMCGSGTFVLEAAEMACGLAPGRSRAFAFEQLAGFDAAGWAEMRASVADGRRAETVFWGSDRDDGAIRSSTANAERAGVAEITQFQRQPISAVQRPDGRAGWVIVNPPYGARIGNRKLLFGLYGSLGQVLRAQFSGWRLGLVTSDGGLAKAVGLPLEAGPPVAFGGSAVKLYQSTIP